jgi:Ser/Thr protein kinase RdoA (MazF antagonist)
VLPTEGGDVWLKAVPPFLAHEGRVLSALQGGPVPRLLAHDGDGRVLLDHVAGENQFHAGPDRLRDMVTTLVDLQSAWVGRDADMLALGMPDWRRAVFVEAAVDTVASGGGALAPSTRSALDALLEGIDDRFDALEACGVPDTLMHGDFHPGNFRSDGRSLVLLDWGDSGLGHPLFDMSSFLDMTPGEHHASLESAWLDLWAAVLPGSDPPRAVRLLGPLSALRRAIVYRRFLHRIEATEHHYHDQDVTRWLARAARFAQVERADLA